MASNGLYEGKQIMGTEWKDYLELVGFVAVVASLILVAYEIRQSSDLVRIQSRTEMAQDTVDLLTLNVDDPDYLDVLNRALAGEELNEKEQAQFVQTYYGWMWHWNNLAYLHRVGLYDEAEFELQIKIIRDELERFPGFRKFWCENRKLVASPDLIEAVEGEPVSNLCE